MSSVGEFGNSRTLFCPAHPAPVPSYVGCAEQELKTTLSSIGQSAAPRHQHTRTLAVVLGSHEKAEPGVPVARAPLRPVSLRWEVSSINFSSLKKKFESPSKPKGRKLLE